MKKVFQNILSWIALFLGAKNELTDEAVNAGICDFSGQSRDKHGN